MWLSAMGVFWVVSNPPVLPLGSEKEVQEFTVATTIFVGCVLSVLSDQLCDVYMNIKSVAELWEVLEDKFFASDAGRELYVRGSSTTTPKWLIVVQSWNKLMNSNLL